MIENLQDELYQLGNKQAKSSKLGATLSWLIVEGWEIKLKMQSFGKNNPSSFNYYKRMSLKHPAPLKLDTKE